MAQLDTDGIPYAHEVKIGMCHDPKCGKLHVILFDEDETPIAVGVIADVEEHLEAVKTWAYIAATRRPG